MKRTFFSLLASGASQLSAYRLEVNRGTDGPIRKEMKRDETGQAATHKGKDEETAARQKKQNENQELQHAQINPFYNSPAPVLKGGPTLASNPGESVCENEGL